MVNYTRKKSLLDYVSIINIIIIIIIIIIIS